MALYIYSAILVVVAMAFIGFIVYGNTLPRPRLIKPSVGSAEQVGDRVPLQTASHIPPTQRAHYDTDPPTSGPHYQIPRQAPMRWGYYGQPVAPEYWVHNLEHSGIVVLYNCPRGCSEDQSRIADFIAGAPRDANFQEVKILALSYPVPGHRFALLAWGWRESLDTWDSSAAERFYEAHVNHGPEVIP